MMSIRENRCKSMKEIFYASMFLLEMSTLEMQYESYLHTEL